CLVTVNIVDSIYFGCSTAESFLVKVNRIGGISKYNSYIENNATTTARVSAAIKKYMDIDNTHGIFLFTDYPSTNVGFMNKTL
ncbi:hypothetical protein J3Q64DRAFT_1617092, partial [Phycomyces blakesleeanus]